MEVEQGLKEDLLELMELESSVRALKLKTIRHLQSLRSYVNKKKDREAERDQEYDEMIKEFMEKQKELEENPQQLLEIIPRKISELVEKKRKRAIARSMKPEEPEDPDAWITPCHWMESYGETDWLENQDEDTRPLPPVSVKILKDKKGMPIGKRIQMVPPKPKKFRQDFPKVFYSHDIIDLNN